MKRPADELDAMWSRHSAEWRDSAQICSQWREAALTDAALLAHKASRGWWDIIAELGITLLVTREYEHLVMAMSAANGRPVVSCFPMPHPSGLVVNRVTSSVIVASTRNPNQTFKFQPVRGLLAPVSSTYYPGSLYLHDLAIIGSSLYGNAVGQNAVVRLLPDASFQRVWWPQSIEDSDRSHFDRNHIQLNSIAAGKSLQSSFFSASSARPGRLRPGHLKYPVDKQGVIFSGRTRQPVCTGLTRPHSARIHDGKVWVANSGYGELGFAVNSRLNVVAKLPGWTRGLCIIKDVAFIATSRVIPRYSAYAPGLDVSKSRCAVQAVSCATGKLLGSIEWPAGNQIFAIDWIDAKLSSGFPFNVRARRTSQEQAFFYTYAAETTGKE
jgi:uncharacterized protein (TIGR03032 family)